jgi:hypothetical protein
VALGGFRRLDCRLFPLIFFFFSFLGLCKEENSKSDLVFSCLMFSVIKLCCVNISLEAVKIEFYNLFLSNGLSLAIYIYIYIYIVASIIYLFPF